MKLYAKNENGKKVLVETTGCGNVVRSEKHKKNYFLTTRNGERVIEECELVPR